MLQPRSASTAGSAHSTITLTARENGLVTSISTPSTASTIPSAPIAPGTGRTVARPNVDATRVARDRGLDAVIAIGAVFVVVFAAMCGFVAYSIVSPVPSVSVVGTWHRRLRFAT